MQARGVKGWTLSQAVKEKAQVDWRQTAQATTRPTRPVHMQSYDTPSVPAVCPGSGS